MNGYPRKLRAEKASIASRDMYITKHIKNFK